MTGDGRLIDPKVMGKIVSLYLMICFAKHYFYGGENGGKSQKLGRFCKHNS